MKHNFDVLSWNTLPAVPCRAELEIPEANARSFADAMRRARLEVEEWDAVDGKVVFMVQASTAQKMHSALKTAPTRFALKEVGLMSRDDSEDSAVLQALASWPKVLVEALGKEYATRRNRDHKRKGSAFDASGEWIPWDVDDLYDYVHNGAMLLPQVVVKQLAELSVPKSSTGAPERFARARCSARHG